MLFWRFSQWHYAGTSADRKICQGSQERSKKIEKIMPGINPPRPPGADTIPKRGIKKVEK